MMARSGDLARNEYKLVGDTKNDSMPPQADSLFNPDYPGIYTLPPSHMSPSLISVPHTVSKKTGSVCFDLAKPFPSNPTSSWSGLPIVSYRSPELAHTTHGSPVFSPPTMSQRDFQIWYHIMTRGIANRRGRGREGFTIINNVFGDVTMNSSREGQQTHLDNRIS